MIVNDMTSFERINEQVFSEFKTLTSNSKYAYQNYNSQVPTPPPDYQHYQHTSSPTAQAWCEFQGLEMLNLFPYALTPFQENYNSFELSCVAPELTYIPVSNVEKPKRPRSTPLKGTRSYVCLECQSGFDTLKGYNSHMVKHATARPFKCLICKDEMKRKGDLLRHVRNTHGKQGLMRCPRCPSVCSLREMPHHVKSVHLDSNDLEIKEFCGILDLVSSFKKRPRKEIS